MENQTYNIINNYNINIFYLVHDEYTKYTNKKMFLYILWVHLCKKPEKYLAYLF